MCTGHFEHVAVILRWVRACGRCLTLYDEVVDTSGSLRPVEWRPMGAVVVWKLERTSWRLKLDIGWRTGFCRMTSLILIEVVARQVPPRSLLFLLLTLWVNRALENIRKTSSRLWASAARSSTSCYVVNWCTASRSPESPACLCVINWLWPALNFIEYIRSCSVKLVVFRKVSTYQVKISWPWGRLHLNSLAG